MSAYALPGLFPPVGEVNFNTFPRQSLGQCDEEQKTDYRPSHGIGPVLAQPSSIRVANARADPVKLIQSLTTRRLSSDSCLLRKRRLMTRGRRHHDRRLLLQISPLEDAMQFILSVSHNGRDYTAPRSLRRIRQLEVALSKENNRSKSLTGTCSPGMVTKTWPPRIPELPATRNECKFLSFTLIHDELRSYSLALEGWFKTILNRLPSVEDSMALSDFLYEPKETSKTVCWEKRQLYAIEEREAEEVDTETGSETLTARETSVYGCYDRYPFSRAPGRMER